jgi:uncharacterized Zn finger protein
MPRATTKPSAASETIHAESGLAPLTREGIEARTDAGSFKRGRGYAHAGRIFGAFRRERTLRARCHGSSGGPYLVEATLAPADKPKAKNPVSYACDCPRGGFCKHVVALLLTWVEQPERFEVRAPIADALGERSRGELIALIEAMVRDVPELEPLLDLPIPAASAASAEAIDEAAIRRQIAAALRDDGGYGRRGWYGYDDYYGASSRMAGNLERIGALADDYANAGDWRNLLLVDATIVEEVAPNLTTMYDESGDLSSLLANADAHLSACLDAQGGLSEEEQLSPAERRRLLDALFTIWQTGIDAGGLDLANEGPEAIARGATPEEQRHVGDRIRESMSSASAADPWTHSWQSRVAIGFLSLLHGEAGLSDEELLIEYRNAELWEEAAESLLKMHRVEEAIALAARRLIAATPLTSFANRLIATGDPQRIEQAIHLVDDMLWEREGQNAQDDQRLRAWLEQQYAAHGHPEKALKLARERFKALPAKATYDAVKAAAILPGQPDDPWPALRKELLATLKKRGDWTSLIEIHLGEGEVAEAIEALKKTEKKDPRNIGYVGTVYGGFGYAYGWGTHPLGWEARVAAAAEAEFPDEAIRIYQRLADRLIATRGRGNYQTATEHLERIKQILTGAERGDAWATLIGELRDRNKTLRALREELDKRGLS